jgi:hypothetical protein
MPPAALEAVDAAVLDAVAAASLAGRPAFQKAKTLSRWVYRRRAHQ